VQIERYHFPEDRFYDRQHNWVRIEDGLVVQGLSDYARQSRGPVLCLDLPRPGRWVARGEPLTVLEAEQGIIRVLAAVSGEVVAINEQLRDNAGLVYEDPYEAGWLVRLCPTSPEELAQLTRPDDPAFKEWFLVCLSGEISRQLGRPEREVLSLRRDLERAYHRLETLYQIGRATTSTIHLEQVLQMVVRLTAEALDAKGCSIRLLDDSGQILRIVAAWGLSDQYLQKGPVEVRHSLIDQEALRGKPVIVLEAPLDPRFQYPEEIEREGICSVLCCPLMVRGQAIGVIRIYSAACYRYGQEEADFLMTIASEVAVAIANAMAYRKLEEIDRAKSQFVLTVTHELRSPVATVQSLLRVISGGYAGQVSSKQKELIERAERRILFLQQLIDDLLDLAAGKTEHLTETPRPVTVNPVVTKVVAQLRPVAEEKSLDLRVYVPHEALSVLAVEDGMERIVVNLVGNAIKYTLPGGRVEVTLERRGNEAVLIVSDTGIGIPQDALPHLFEEFFRAENARAIEREGTGLGLSIVKNLVERYGGRIAVESQLGQGSTFTVRFPLLGTGTVDGGIRKETSLS
jgi:signal transduction histidine kinase/glycine cleavage system H lipoate-binding protein